MELRAEAAQLPLGDATNRTRGLSPGGVAAKEKADESTLRYAPVASGPYDGLTVLYGHPLAPRVALQAAADRVMAGSPVVYLDGAHTFDPFFVGRLARARRQQPRKILAMIHVARAFSAPQMERLLSNCLAGALERYQTRTAVISGLVETLSDDTLSERDIVRLSDRMVESLSHLARQGFVLLCPCPAVPMPTARGHRLFAGLRTLAERLIHVHEAEGKVVLDEEMRRTKRTASS
jgi:hypothetical protein